MDLPPGRIKVYADYDVINKNLHHPGFEIVENMNEADVLWLMSHFKDFRYIYFVLINDLVFNSENGI